MTMNLRFLALFTRAIFLKNMALANLQYLYNLAW